jgi:hypothetical protein
VTGDQHGGTAVFGGAPVRPRYGTGSLAEVLPSAFAVLGADEPDRLGLRATLDGVRRVAVLLVDGLGWHQFTTPAAAVRAPTLAALVAEPDSRPITAAFPSTTPVSLVTIGTGRPPGAHGILGFNVRVPETGAVLTHIAWTDEPDVRAWQPVDPAFTRAAAAGLRTTVVSRPQFDGTSLSTAAYRGARFRGAADPVTLAAEMIDALSANDLVYGYHPDLDAAGHTYGAASTEWLDRLAGVDRLVGSLVDHLPRDGALLVTADHGMLNIPADRRIDLDADPRLRAGVYAVAGEPRVRYLHVVPGAVEDVVTTWREVLGDVVWVVSREEAVAAGWFGPVDPAHLARIGDVIVVCAGDVAILSSAGEPPRVGQMIGFHGSFSGAEMDIPLLVARGR